MRPKERRNVRTPVTAREVRGRKNEERWESGGVENTRVDRPQKEVSRQGLSLSLFLLSLSYQIKRQTKMNQSDKKKETKYL